jgi:hypothetical protein
MCTRNLPGGGGGGKRRPVRKADNHTTICEPVVQINTGASTACYKDSFIKSSREISRVNAELVTSHGLSPSLLMMENPSVSDGEDFIVYIRPKSFKICFIYYYRRSCPYIIIIIIIILLWVSC